MRSPDGLCVWCDVEGADLLYPHPLRTSFTSSICRFIKGTIADQSPIVPISAQHKYNIDVVCEFICSRIPIPKRNFTASPKLIVIRSFDVNKPGEEVDNLKGGVAGGSIIEGVLKLGQEIEVRPGIMNKVADGSMQCTPIRSVAFDVGLLPWTIPGDSTCQNVGTCQNPLVTPADTCDYLC